MIKFRNFLLLKEELNDKQKEEVSKWPRDPKAIEATDHYFGKDNHDITEHLAGTQDKSEIHKQIERHLGRPISPEDYKSNKAIDHYGRHTSISKLISKHPLLQNFNNDSTRQGNKYTGLSVHVTRSPHGVAGQTSSGQSWEQESCKNFQNGCNKDFLKSEVKHGTVVAYLKDHKGKEIARSTLHPHHNNAGHVAYAVNSHYGIDHADFHEHVDDVVKKLSGPHKGGNPLYNIHPDVYNNSYMDYILHPFTTPEELNSLSDKNPNTRSIQKAVFNHPNVTNEMLHKGIKSDNEDMSYIALASRKIKSEHLDTALKHKNPMIRREATYSNKITGGQLHTSLKDEDEDIRASAAAHQKIKPEHIDVAMKDPSENVRNAALSQPLATSDHIHQGLDSPNHSTKLYAIYHPNATAEHITKALNVRPDYNENGTVHFKNNDSITNEIHAIALNHRNATEDHFRQVLDSPHFSRANKTNAQTHLNALTHKWN